MTCRRLAPALLALAVSLAAPATARADEPPIPAYTPPVPIEVDDTASITFDRLVIKADTGMFFRVSSSSFRVSVLEQLQAAGYNTLGLDASVFNQQDSSKARYALGGELTELRCKSGECQIGVTWALLDRSTDQIVYRVASKGYARSPDDPRTRVGPIAVSRTVDSLLSRQAFADLVSRTKDVDGSRTDIEWENIQGIQACESTTKKLPAGLPGAIDTTLLLTSAAGTGGGVLISPDGYALTAAHVVAGQKDIIARRQSGDGAEVEVLRIDRFQDIALVRLKTSFETPCTPLADGIMDVGADIYAIGSPGGEELAFSVSRGIVSGNRSFGDVRFVQTDASLNEGNSGGPLFAQDGRVGAIVSWKIKAPGFEGLGFGVPVQRAVERLGVELRPGPSDDLEPVKPEEGMSVAGDTFTDTADRSYWGWKPWVSPRAKARKQRGTAIALGGIGGALIAGTWGTTVALQRSDQVTWRGLQGGNGVGWGLLVGGTLGAVLIQPKNKSDTLPPSDNASGPAEPGAEANGGDVSLAPAGHAPGDGFLGAPRSPSFRATVVVGLGSIGITGNF